MAIKWKNSKIGQTLICLAIAVVSALAIFPIGFRIYDVAKEQAESVFDQEDFGENLYTYCIGLYYRINQLDMPFATGLELYFPQLAELSESEFIVYEGDAIYTLEDILSKDELEWEVETTLQAYLNRFDYRWQSMDYLVLQPDRTMGANASDLLALAQGTATQVQKDSLADRYQYYAVLQFGSNGELTIGGLYGGSSSAFQSAHNYDLLRDLFNREEAYDLASQYSALASPRDTTFVFAIPRELPIHTWVDSEQELLLSLSMERSGYNDFFFGALFLVFLLSLLLAATLGVRWPVTLETAVLMAIAAATMVRYATHNCAISLYNDTPIINVLTAIMGQDSAVNLSYYLTLLLLTVGLYCFILCSMSLWQIRTMGLGRYLTEKTILARLFRRMGRGLTQFYHWVTDIDLTMPGDRILLKVLSVNLVILIVCCCMWLFGIVGLVFYTLILFYLLRRQLRKIQAQFNTLLDAAGEMAEGRLDTEIQGDFGLFTPIMEELEQVQQGFQRAVEAETKSQAMKTELITNVSHDLKTPLTAIITYINLLGQEDLTPDQRKAYLETLDRKAKRLTILIEDLFEMSKASSKNLVLTPMPVDLSALIRQVAIESEEALDEAGITLRFQMPEERVVTILDGEKTSRIFDNLIRNISLYGLSGSRAHIKLERVDGTIRVELKNVSREPLDFDTQAITERFVRGDRSRSTEGSGLGLAIAKSLVELQGGSFHIEVEDDIYKAVVILPDCPPDVPQEPLTLPEAPTAPPLPEEL